MAEPILVLLGLVVAFAALSPVLHRWIAFLPREERLFVYWRQIDRDSLLWAPRGQFLAKNHQTGEWVLVPEWSAAGREVHPYEKRGQFWLCALNPTWNGYRFLEIAESDLARRSNGESFLLLWSYGAPRLLTMLVRRAWTSLTSLGLWGVHVEGPDTLIAMPDRETAVLRAAQWNRVFQAIGKKCPSPHNPTCRAVVVRWKDRASHARDLEKHGGDPDDIC